MMKRTIDPAIKELLQSVNAHQINSCEYILPMEIWLKQREIINSTMGKIGSKRLPFVRVIFSCAVCKKEVIRPRAEIEKQFKKCKDYSPCCGKQCSTRLNNHKRGMTLHRTCNWCGVSIDASKKGARVCSKECRVSSQRAGIINSKGVPRRLCDICKTSYKPANNTYQSRFCSMECKNLAQSLAMLGESNSNWKGGLHPNRYQHGEGQKLREMKKMTNILDGHQCIICSAQGKLYSHHVDLDKNNNTAQNLVTLCARCHKKTHVAIKQGKTQFQWLKKYAKDRTYLTSKLRIHHAFLLATP